MPHVRVLVLRAPGTNCDLETAHAFTLAGGEPERRHVNEVLADPGLLDRYQVLCLPGGFSYGDDVAAGRILGNQLRHHLADELNRFRDEGKLILGICNGFQVLMRSGLLASESDRDARATLTWNESGRFEDRWVRLRVTSSKSVFFAGIDEMELPVAHAEGRFVASSPEAFARLEQAGRLALRYTRGGQKGRDANPATTIEYPYNPNGSAGNVASLCDETGRICGLMPHPERYVQRTQHPCWTRGPLPEAGAGLRVFQNAVAFFR